MKSGDQCPRKCGGQLIVRTSITLEATRVRYLTCNRCRCNGGKWMVPESTVIKRKVAEK